MAGGGRIRRLHGPFVSDVEVESVVNHLKAQGAPDYLDSITADEDELAEEGGAAGGDEFGGSGDELYDKAVNIVLQDKKASTSYIQRRLAVGYNKAASLIERMEKEGVISPANHSGKREILVGSGAEEY
jgi:S-DNA-T family DNA segregation ATPase FtsK/SpoIIIE